MTVTVLERGDQKVWDISTDILHIINQFTDDMKDYTFYEIPVTEFYEINYFLLVYNL